MILTAHQPVYLPWLGLFHKIALADTFVVFDQVQYVPKDWISRNQIKTASGATMLTVPVLTKGHRDKTIAEMEINNGEPWRRKHLKTIQINYQNAPYFKQYIDFFEDVYNREWTHLSPLNTYMLKWFLKELGITTTVLMAGDYHFEGFKSDLVLNMCLQLKAEKYIFGALGADYADVEGFKSAGVIPEFQAYVHPEYRQMHGGFLPYMSVVDLLFNEGPRSFEIIMSGNQHKAD